MGGVGVVGGEEKRENAQGGFFLYLYPSMVDQAHIRERERDRDERDVWLGLSKNCLYSIYSFLHFFPHADALSFILFGVLISVEQARTYVLPYTQHAEPAAVARWRRITGLFQIS